MINNIIPNVDSMNKLSPNLTTVYSNPPPAGYMSELIDPTPPRTWTGEKRPPQHPPPPAGSVTPSMYTPTGQVPPLRDVHATPTGFTTAHQDAKTFSQVENKGESLANFWLQGA